VAVAAVAIASLVLMMVAMWSGWGMGIGMGPGHMRNMHGGGVDTSNAPATTGGAIESVEIRDFLFTPGNLQVPVGAKVTWTNYDDAPHTATAKDGSWDTGILNKGQAATITFDKAGDYMYYCKVHPNMVARITVG
jgi:plastocyanin